MGRPPKHGGPKGAFERRCGVKIRCKTSKGNGLGRAQISSEGAEFKTSKLYIFFDQEVESSGKSKTGKLGIKFEK